MRRQETPFTLKHFPSPIGRRTSGTASPSSPISAERLGKAPPPRIAALAPLSIRWQHGIKFAAKRLDQKPRQGPCVCACDAVSAFPAGGAKGHSSNPLGTRPATQQDRTSMASRHNAPSTSRGERARAGFTVAGRCRPRCGYRPRHQQPSAPVQRPRRGVAAGPAYPGSAQRYSADDRQDGAAPGADEELARQCRSNAPRSGAVPL